jgi:Ubiquitin elongating factor core
MLKRRWVDQRNRNAQDSLLRSLDFARGEAESAATRPLTSSAKRVSLDEDMADASPIAVEVSSEVDTRAASVEVSSEFNFVTEDFFTALRAIQLAFLPGTTTHADTMSRLFSRLKDIVRDLENLTWRAPSHAIELRAVRTRFGNLLQVNFCYDVDIHDDDLLSPLVRFGTQTGWSRNFFRNRLARDSILPFPVPPPAVSVSLPEHTIETMATVLTTNHPP